MSNKHATGRHGTHHAKTRRRAYPSAQSLTVPREDSKYGKRGNAPSPRGKRRGT